ncbi:DNA-binding transcriptional LysR family regulator [Nitrobacteraceae bacterium AZCC 1564]
MNVSIRHLRAFVAISELRSFTLAARRLHVTQSALSLLIRDLERELKVRLMDRGPRGISLTAAGIDFLPPATKVIEDLEAAVSGAAQLRDRRRGIIRVSCTPLYASTFVPEVVAGFRAQFPNIDIRLLDTLNEEVVRRVLIGEADLGVAPQRPTPPEIDETPLFADRIDVVCPRHHELAKQKFVTWKKVLSYPFVSLTRDFTARLQTDLSARSSSLVISPVHEVSYLATAFGLVKIGQGITAQPLAAKPMLASFGLVSVPTIQPIIYRNISLFTRRGHTLSPAAEGFRDFAVANAAKPDG